MLIQINDELVFDCPLNEFEIVKDIMENIGDTNFEEIIWPDNLDTSNVIDMSYLFANCNNLSIIDVSSFDTSSVENMQYMFASTKVENLDLSNFSTSNVINMFGMLFGCTELNTIYASNKFITDNVTVSTNMFYGDNNLVGGNSATYNSSKRDKTYARIDKEETPGYFTLKSA